MSEIVIVIPTKRPPPIQTLENYSPGDHPTGFVVIVVADPRVYQAHLDHYACRVSERMPGMPAVDVVLGKIGMGAQARECYVAARAAGYRFLFRMDDDLRPKTFVHENGTFPSLPEVISEAWACLNATDTSLVGFCNTSNRSWMAIHEYKRTYGLVHGGASLAIANRDPDDYMDSSIARGEDVYRTCAHREEDLLRGNDGSVGRVAHVGFDKRGSTVTAGQTSISVSQGDVDRSRDLILERFTGLVTCDGTRLVTPGSDVMIANWRFRRTPANYVPWIGGLRKR